MRLRLRLGAKHVQIIQRVGQWREGLCLRLDAIEDRGLFLERVTQAFQTFLGYVENQVALGCVIFSQTLEVVLNAGDGVRQGVEVLPVGHSLACQQLLLDIAVAGVEQIGGTLQRDHRQTTTHLGQQLRHAGQVLVVPLRGDKFDDRVFGLFQAVARFLDHQLMNLRHVSGRQMAFFTPAILRRTDHASQGRFDVQQRAGDIHQHRITGLTLPFSQAADHIELIGDDLARLAKAQHREGVGNLLERRGECIQVRNLTAIAAHEQIKAVLDPHQFFTQCGDHGTHGVTIRPGQAGALLVDHLVIRQRVVEAVLFTQGAHTRRLRRGLGHIEQQVLA